MQRTSVIVPTRNRPHLLRQALESVAAQTHRDLEIIVIDDGSTPGVDLRDVTRAANQNVILLRNETPNGQARSRERAGDVATGDFFLHLDDDDLLSPELISRGVAAFDLQPDVDVVLFNAKGFGTEMASFDRNQQDALNRVLQSYGHVEPKSALIRFDRSVFPALLRAVPMAFQRPMSRRRAWQDVTQLRRRAYGERHLLAPPLRESEWALYAAATKRLALITEPLYLQRCEGQGFFSIASGREAADRALIEIFEHLAVLSKSEPCFGRWQTDIRRALARCHFDNAHANFYRGARTAATQHWIKAVRLHPNSAYFRFGLRMLLPRGEQNY